MCCQRALKLRMPFPSVSPTWTDAEVRVQGSSSDLKTLELWPASITSSGQPILWGWLTFVVILAAVPRALALNQQLWFDEIVTLLDSVHEPISRIATTYNSQNQHMLYSILAHCSVGLFGEHPWALRLPAVLFGVASIPALYFFARLVTTNREALFASSLMGVNYQHIWFSQDARGYTGMAFWALLASIFFVRCAAEGKTRDWIVYGLAAALGVYTHLTMAFVIIGHAIVYAWLVASRARSAGRWSRGFLRLSYGFALAGGVAFLLYVPVLSRIFARTVSVSSKSVRSEWTSPLWAIGEMFRGLRTGISGGVVVVLIGGLLLVSGLASYWRNNRFLVGLVVVPGLATALAVLATSHNLWPRFFFFEIGFGLLFLVRGAVVWGNGAAKTLGGTGTLGLRLGSSLVTIMLLASVSPLRAEYLHPKQDFIGAMRFVDDQQLPDEQVVTVGIVTTAYQRYYGRTWPLLETPTQLNSVLKQDHATWLIYAMPIAIRATTPELWETMQTKFKVVRVFSGTLSGGEIYVCKSTAKDSSAAVPITQ